MKGFKRQLREGIYTALNGNISVDVFDGNAAINTTSDKWVVIGNVSKLGDENTQDGTFRSDVQVQVVICNLFKTAFNHDVVDDIEDELLQILIPDVSEGGFSVTGFDVQNVKYTSSSYSDEQGTDGTLAKIILNIECQLRQQ